jgi:hypothetical protein
MGWVADHILYITKQMYNMHIIRFMCISYQGDNL